MARDECGGLYCDGKLQKTQTLSGEVEWVCGKCGKRYSKTGARIDG